MFLKSCYIIRTVIGVMLAVGMTVMSARGNSTPEPYIWRSVVIGGGGFVTAIIPHPAQKGLLYARTDVGGAYRWDDSAKCWVPITDWIGMADGNLTGIESLAIDLSDSNRVYLAAGIYSNPQSSNGAILCSADQGRTWQRTDMPFKMGGNEIGRCNGERLAIDPNDGKILFFGSRRDGLWKSNDRGATWNQMKSFPTAGTPMPVPTNTFPQSSSNRFRFPPQQVGIVFVQFDPRSSSRGNPTPVIYVGVSVLETNLFCTIDGGITWQAVPGQPVGMRPNHAVLASGGMMYLSYGKEPGPNTMTDGAVWKFNTKSGEWTDITPVQPSTSDQPFGYGSVAVDAAHPDTIVVTTFCHWKPHDEIFRSTNGGVSWFPLLEKAKFDHSFAPYTKTIKPHWMGDIQIDPFDSKHVLFTTGYGIWSCTNLANADSRKSTRWLFTDNGLEETVPLDLISPPEGAHLLSVLGDIDGFKHDDLNISPRKGAFKAPPHYVNTESIAFAAKKPNLIVRAGTLRTRTNETHGAYSSNGGKTWKSFKTEPPDGAGAGTITVSANGKTIVWTPRRGTPHFSHNKGASWKACGDLDHGLRVVADSVNPEEFYTLDLHTGKFYVSTNGAATFTVVQTNLPVTGGSGIVCAAPDREGDVWICFRKEGLHHSMNAGMTFDKLNSVQEAYSLGFGRAADGKNYPALYLAGKVNEVQALFRSDDAGATWARINDDQHQFGWISHVTGDPRIYGRVYFATGGRGIIYGDRAR
jgi:photosystem II stability/assembly factor-like uncharacterized protein